MSKTQRHERKQKRQQMLQQYQQQQRKLREQYKTFYSFTRICSSVCEEDFQSFKKTLKHASEGALKPRKRCNCTIYHLLMNAHSDGRLSTEWFVYMADLLLRDGRVDPSCKSRGECKHSRDHNHAVYTIAGYVCTFSMTTLLESLLKDERVSLSDLDVFAPSGREYSLFSLLCFRNRTSIIREILHSPEYAGRLSTDTKFEAIMNFRKLTDDDYEIQDTLELLLDEPDIENYERSSNTEEIPDSLVEVYISKILRMVERDDYGDEGYGLGRLIAIFKTIINKPYVRFDQEKVGFNVLEEIVSAVYKERFCVIDSYPIVVEEEEAVQNYTYKHLMTVLALVLVANSDSCRRVFSDDEIESQLKELGRTGVCTLHTEVIHHSNVPKEEMIRMMLSYTRPVSVKSAVCEEYDDGYDNETFTLGKRCHTSSSGSSSKKPRQQDPLDDVALEHDGTEF